MFLSHHNDVPRCMWKCVWRTPRCAGTAVGLTLKHMRVLHATSAWVQCLDVTSARIVITDCVYLILSCV